MCTGECTRTAAGGASLGVWCHATPTTTSRTPYRTTDLGSDLTRRHEGSRRECRVKAFDACSDHPTLLCGSSCLRVLRVQSERQITWDCATAGGSIRRVPKRVCLELGYLCLPVWRAETTRLDARVSEYRDPWHRNTWRLGVLAFNPGPHEGWTVGLTQKVSVANASPMRFHRGRADGGQREPFVRP